MSFKNFYFNNISKQTGPQILSFPSQLLFSPGIWFSYGDLDAVKPYIFHIQKLPALISIRPKAYAVGIPPLIKTIFWLQCLCRSQQHCVAGGTVFLVGKWWAMGNFELFRLTRSYRSLQSVIYSLISYWIGFKVALFLRVFLWPGPRISKLTSQNEHSDWWFCSTGKRKPSQG